MMMSTMHPVVVLGSYRWDADVLPPDEFEARLQAVRAIMAREGWDGLVVHGDAQHSGLLTWLTNSYPRLHFQLALIGPQGEPEILAQAAARDLPASAALTWCRSFHGFAEAPPRLAAWLQRLGEGQPSGRAPRVAVHGTARMRAPVRAVLREALGNPLLDATPVLEPVLAVKRPRELSLLRRAHAILAGTVETLRDAWTGGATMGEAVLAAERAARLGEAQDVRILYSVDGGRTLVPYETVCGARPAERVAFVAVRYLGYWATSFVSDGMEALPVHRATCARLAALVDAVRPGADAASLMAALPPLPAGMQVHPMTGHTLAHGVGLDAVEPPVLDAMSAAASGAAVLCDGGVYTLVAGLVGEDGRGALLSRTVCLVDGQPQPLSA